LLEEAEKEDVENGDGPSDKPGRIDMYVLVGDID